MTSKPNNLSGSYGVQFQRGLLYKQQMKTEQMKNETCFINRLLLLMCVVTYMYCIDGL